jgi:class 3 adenylate cyclase/tetratricopeptide (TPR) repeat protein
MPALDPTAPAPDTTYPHRTALVEAINALQARRTLLGDALTDAALAPLLERLAAGCTPQQAAVPARRLRQVSVLFLDLVGSTHLIQRLDPEEVQAVIDSALASFSAIVERHGGEVLRYAGDSLKAAFGARVTREDDAERAVLCGLDLLQAAARAGDGDGAQLSARVGIHTGAAVRGGGVEQDNSLSGLAVNVAARLEQTAAPGTLRISIDTYRLVQGHFDVLEQPGMQVKGLQEPLRAFVVTGARERRLRGLRFGAEGMTSPLIDRQEELGRLHRLAATAFEPGGGLHAATVLGEAGLGKSRLLAEFQATLPALMRTGELWRVSSHQQGQDQPYGLLRDLLFWRLGIRDSDSQEQAQSTFAAALAPVFGPGAEEHTALLGQLIGLDFSASPFIASIVRDGRQLRARGLNAWVRLLQRQAAAQPLVLMLDDLQWADDESLAAMDHLVSTCPGLPIVLLCAARPEFVQRRPQWGEPWPRHEWLHLSPLGAQGSEALAAGLLARFAMPVPALQALLAEQAAGNPFYMEALLQMLVDTEVIQTTGEHWQLHQERLANLRVPATLVGVLQATLDALGADQRRSLQLASVVGAQFWDEALATIDARAPDHLPVLSQRGLALPQAQSTFEGTHEYSFRHHLLHQVTYGTVLKADKRAAHGQAARWLQARGLGRENELASQIAEHFDRAGDKEQAVVHWTRAAEDAGRRQADTLALAHSARALALDDGSDLHRLVRLHQLRANAFLRAMKSVEHGQEVATLESLADRLDDDVLRLTLAYGQAWRLIGEGKYDAANELCERRLARAGSRSPADAARLHDVISICLVRLCRMDEAQVHAQRGLQQARVAGDRLTEGNILNNTGVHHMEADRLSEAVACYEQAIAAYRASSSRHGVVNVMLNLAVIEETVGRFDKARTLYEEVLAECDDVGAFGLKGMACANLGGVLAELGDGQKAYDAALESLRLARVSADRRTEAFAHRGARMAAGRLGRWRDALDHGRAASSAFTECGYPSMAWVEASMVARILSSQGEQTLALAEANALLAEVERRGGWGDCCDAQWHLHCVLAPLGDERADVLLESAHRGLNTLADRYADVVPRASYLVAASTAREIGAAWHAAHGSTGRAN